VANKIHNFVGIAPLIVIPADKLNKVVVEGNAGLGIKYKSCKTDGSENIFSVTKHKVIYF